MNKKTINNVFEAAFFLLGAGSLICSVCNPVLIYYAGGFLALGWLLHNEE